MSENRSVSTTQSTSPKRTLRIALAMRGGVSMAVWIGGAVAELDLVRRASLTPIPTPGPHASPEHHRAHVYKELLAAAGFDKVEFDILAGASAGGLNAVLFALAQSYGVVTDDIVRDMWLKDGGLWDLLRTPDKEAEADGKQRSGFSAVDSVLSGDGRFLTLAREAIEIIVGESWNPPQAEESSTVGRVQPQDRLTVELAATVLPDPKRRSMPSRAGFSFTRRPGGLGSTYSTIPGAIDVDQSAAIHAQERMALSMRATSSFPGAFEPASVHSSQPTPMTDLSAPGDMQPVFSLCREANDADDPFLVIDGGVFDNIPIDRAVRAIQRASATDPTQRVLIYLDPQPPSQPEPQPAPSPAKKGTRARNQSAQLSRWLNVITTGMSLKQREESAADEITYIREHNDSVKELQGRLDSLAAWLSNPGTRLPNIGLRDYLASRAGADAERYALILTKPNDVLVSPGFPAQPWVPVNAEASLAVAEAVERAYAAISSRSTTLDRHAWHVVTIGDAGAAIDASLFLIAWTRMLQDTDTVSCNDAPLLRRVKRCLYRCLSILLRVRRQTVDDAVRSTTDSDALSTAIVAGISHQLFLTLDQGLDSLLNHSEPGDDSEFYVHLSSALGMPGTATASTAIPHSAQLLTTVWSRLDSYLRALRTIHPGQAERNDSEWSDSIYNALRQRVSAHSHSAYEITRLLSVSGVPGGQSMIRYHEITGNQTPALDNEHVSELRSAAIHSQLASWLRKNTALEHIDPEQLSAWMSHVEGVNRAEDKLCGTPLARFAGFFDWRWRSNDWTWGRMDAAAGIADLLEATARDENEEQSTASESDSTARDLQQCIFADLPTSLAMPPRGMGVITGLPSSYRVGLVSRASSLVIRALQPATVKPSVVKKSIVVAAVAALRVIPPLLGLLVDPIRLAIALGATLLASEVLPGDSGTDESNWRVFGFLTTLVGLGIGWRWWAARKKWHGMNERWERAKQVFPAERQRVFTDWRRAFTEAQGRARPYLWVTLCFGVAYACIGIALWLLATVLACHPMEAALAVWFPLLGLAGWLFVVCTRVTPPRSGHEAGRVGRSAARRLAFCCAAGLLIVVVVLGIGIDISLPGTIASAVSVASVLTAALVACSLWGWVPLRETYTYAAPAALLAGIVTGVVAHCWAQNNVLVILVPVATWWIWMAVFLGNVTPLSSKAMGLLPEESSDDTASTANPS